jgi:hypothetical protein
MNMTGLNLTLLTPTSHKSVRSSTLENSGLRYKPHAPHGILQKTSKERKTMKHLTLLTPTSHKSVRLKPLENIGPTTIPHTTHPKYQRKVIVVEILFIRAREKNERSSQHNV